MARKTYVKYFLQFLDLERITGSNIGAALLSFYKSSGSDIKQCRGQCYDGAPNMQSEKLGTASWILRESNKAITTHYYSHNLNLSFASTCKLPIVDNVLEKYKSLQIYFNSSPKREKLLEYTVSLNNEMNDSRRSILLGMCKTTWCGRDVSYERFYLAMPYIMEVLEVMNGTLADINQLDETYSKGESAKDKQEASTYLHALSHFNFVIALISLYCLMHPSAGITKKLQGRSTDVVHAFNEVESDVSGLGAVRSNIDSEFDTIYKKAVTMAERMNVTPSTPRMAQRQMHRDNIEAANTKENFKRIVAIPILDTLISEMKIRFNKLSIMASKLLYLVPELICSESDITAKLAPIIEMYKADLINPDIVDQEITLWMKKWANVPKLERGSTLATAIKECDEDHFPNIFVLLKIACTLPVTSWK